MSNGRYEEFKRYGKVSKTTLIFLVKAMIKHSRCCEIMRQKGCVVVFFARMIREGAVSPTILCLFSQGQSEDAVGRLRRVAALGDPIARKSEIMICNVGTNDAARAPYLLMSVPSVCAEEAEKSVNLWWFLSAAMAFVLPLQSKTNGLDGQSTALNHSR